MLKGIFINILSNLLIKDECVKLTRIIYNNYYSKSRHLKETVQHFSNRHTKYQNCYKYCLLILNEIKPTESNDAYENNEFLIDWSCLIQSLALETWISVPATWAGNAFLRPYFQKRSEFRCGWELTAVFAPIVHGPGWPPNLPTVFQVCRHILLQTP